MILLSLQEELIVFRALYAAIGNLPDDMTPTPEAVALLVRFHDRAELRDAGERQYREPLGRRRACNSNLPRTSA